MWTHHTHTRTTHTDCGDPVLAKGGGGHSEKLVIQLELFTLSILKVWLVGKIKDCQETDVSYGMFHLLKLCLLSSVQLCRPRPLVCICVCMCICVCVSLCVCWPFQPIHCCFFCFLMERTGALKMIMFLLWIRQQIVLYGNKRGKSILNSKHADVQNFNLRASFLHSYSKVFF